MINNELMGIEINNYTFNEAVEKAICLMNSDFVSQVVTINPEMFAQAEKDQEFLNIVTNSEMVVPDGVGIKLALKFKGKNIEVISGIDFSRELLNRCAADGYKVAIVGSKEDVIAKAVENLKNEIPNINIVYWHNGYFDDNNQIYNEIKASEPNLVLVALGSPKQEYFIYNAKNILPPCLMIGIGGSLDVWSGNVKRAPKLFQKLGLEWLYRTICEPSRFKRIFPALPLFLIKSIFYKKEKTC